MKIAWRTLQFLDLDHFFGRPFRDNVSKLEDATERYVQACVEIGMAP